MSALVIVSGPSGVGKNTTLLLVHQRFPEFEVAETWTTRDHQARDDGGFKRYQYVSLAAFKESEGRDCFLETAQYTNHWYGTRQPTSEQPTLMEIEVQGAQQVVRKRPDALRIGLLPPGTHLEEQLGHLRRRLVNGRGEVETKIAVIRAQWPFVVVNDDPERAADEMCQIITNHLAT